MERIMGEHGSGLRYTTKADLIVLLDRYDDDAVIVLGYTGADHWRTECVASITTAKEVNLVESAYSRSGFAQAPEDADEEDGVFMIGDDEDHEPLTVVVLS